MGPWRLHKLLYWSQGWHLAWDGEPMFLEPIFAWGGGPVVAALYGSHEGTFTVGGWPQGRISSLASGHRESIDAVLDFYGDRGSYWLNELVRNEPPYLKAREGLRLDQRGRRRISLREMQDYFANLSDLAPGDLAETEVRSEAPGFERILEDGRGFEILGRDRIFNVGELLLLCEWDPDKKRYTGRRCRRRITHIQMPGVRPGLDGDFVIVGLA